MVKDARQVRRVGGPFLEAAVICEQVIREKDGAFSVIRMVNKLTLHEAVIPKKATLALPLIGVVSFKAGDFKGRKRLSIYVTDPSGKRTVMPVYEGFHWMEFEGGDTGVLGRYPLYLTYTDSGTYWFDIVMGRRVRSRMPLTLIVHEKSPPDKKHQKGESRDRSR